VYKADLKLEKRPFVLINKKARRIGVCATNANHHQKPSAAPIGRGILLGLEWMVGADIILTISAPLTFESLGLLAALVVIRTFLSFSLETEIEGCWPWQRAAKDSDARSVNRSDR